MGNDPEKYEPPKQSGGDYAVAVVRAAVGSIPVAGSAAVELFNALVIPPLERRRDKWREAVSQGFRKLEDRVAGFSVEKLVDDEEFTSTLLVAPCVAMRSHQAENTKSCETRFSTPLSGEHRKPTSSLCF